MEITPVLTSSCMGRMVQEDQHQQHLSGPNHPVAGTGLDVDLCLDQLQALLVSEQSYLVPTNTVSCCKYRHEHQHHPEEQEDQHHAATTTALLSTTEEWRNKICQWSYRVVDNFRLDRSVVSMAMNLLDRFLIAYHQQQQQRPQGPQDFQDYSDDDDEEEDDYDDDIMSTTSSSCGCLSCKRSIDSRTFQLASMTCLFLAIKVSAEAETEDEITRRKAFRLVTFVDLSRGLFSADDIIQMEQDILTTLAWRVHPPASMTFVPYLLLLLPPTRDLPLESQSSYGLVQHVLRELSRYLTELAVCLGSDLQLAYPPSQIAFCSILVSMNLLTPRALPPSVRKTFTQAAMRLFTTTTSSSTTTTTATAMASSIQRLSSQLMNALWPEMILEDGATADPNHPISMAREYGLLDTRQICQYRMAQLASLSSSDQHSCQAAAASCQHHPHDSPPRSPRGVDLNSKPIVSWPGSPVSVVSTTTTSATSSSPPTSTTSPSST